MSDTDGHGAPMQSKVFFFAILIGMLLLAWMLFKPFILYIVTGIFISVLAIPIDKKWEKILPNRVAAFGTLLTIMVLVFGPIIALGFALARDVRAAVDALQGGLVTDVINDIAGLLMPGATQEEITARVNQIWGDTVLPLLINVGQGLLSQAGGFIVQAGIAITVILFVMYYVLTDGDKLVEYIRRAAPLPAGQADYLLEESHNGLKAVFYGQILTSLIQGALGGIGFLIAGVPGAIIWTFVMAVLSLLPVIGPPVVWVPAAIFLLVQGDIWQGVFLLAWGGIVVAQVDNFVRPKLIGNRADIHPLFVLIGVLGGVAAFGFIGLFLGPLLVGITVSVLKVWEADYIDPTLKGHHHQHSSTVPHKHGHQEEEAA